jgi:outer membrane usher protein FimD/PapC
MRRLLPLAVWLALAQAAAASGNEGPPAFEPAIVELRVNGQDDGPTLVVRRDGDGALLLRAEDLAQLRIRTPSRGLLLVDGERYFRFSPDNGAEIIFDEATQSARITLPPAAFLPTRALLRPTCPG